VVVVEAEPDGESSARQAGASSTWTVSWAGALHVLLIAAIALIGWRLLASAPTGSQGDEGRGEGVVSETSEPAGVDDSSAPSTAPRPSTTTISPPSSTSPATTTTVASERRVIISGEMKPCRYGSNCLVASFTIEGFDPHPGAFACIYPNSTTNFGFGDDDVIDACLTGDEGDTITVEVDGVRSATISERDLDGTEQRE